MASRPKLKTPKRIREIIARREFEAVLDGRPTQVQLVFGKPVQIKKPDPWACDYQVRGLGRWPVRRVYGIDAVQALLGALHVAEAELSGLVDNPDVQLRWLGGKRLGLHRPKKRGRRT
jgi:hypothetical protein